MDVLLGIGFLALGLLAWVGQVWSLLAPNSAQRLNLVERKDSVEPVYWADVRGEAAWDTLTLWTLPAAGFLLLIGAGQWAYLGLVGGAIYVYFGGRGILTRLEMLRAGFRIGAPNNVRLGLLMLAVWGLAGIVALALGAIELAG